MRLRAFIAVALVFGLLSAFVTFTRAQENFESTSQLVTMSWSFRNNHPNKVYLRFFSQDRDAVWPGPDEYYVLDDGDPHEARLRCWEGEKICYGAWTTGGDEWGVGENDASSCNGCCTTCWSGDEGTRNLNP